MLHYETIEPATLDLLKNIQKIPYFRELRLVGGTSLALQFGHRKSIDLDFFGKFNLSNDELFEWVTKIHRYAMKDVNRLRSSVVL